VTSKEKGSAYEGYCREQERAKVQKLKNPKPITLNIESLERRMDWIQAVHDIRKGLQT